MRVGLVDLHDPDVVLAQVAHQCGGIGAGRLDRDRVDLAEADQPVERLRVAGGGGREALGGQQRPSLIERREVMGIGVSVDAADNQRLLLLRHAVHGCPSCWAGRPGREGRTEQ